MPGDANAILISVINLDSGNHGNGSGSTPTTAPGAALSIEEEAEIAITAFCKASDTGGEPGDADTLDFKVEVSVDGGTVWGDLCVFDTLVGTDLPDDTAAGDKTVRRAIRCKLPRADAGQSNLVIIRPVTVASDASNWALYSDVRTPDDIRTEWEKNAITR